MHRQRVRGWLCIALLLMITFVVAGVVSGQSARPIATLDDLLVEVRGVRAEINEVAAAGIRAQLLAARLSLQEQRIRMLADQFAEAQRMLRTSVTNRSARAAHLNRVEDSLREGPRSSTKGGEFDVMLKQLREDVDRSEQEELALRVQEQELRNTLSAAERLWVDFSSRLDSIERDLPATRQP
jgi:hypothetical protein